MKLEGTGANADNLCGPLDNTSGPRQEHLNMKIVSHQLHSYQCGRAELVEVLTALTLRLDLSELRDAIAGLTAYLAQGPARSVPSALAARGLYFG